MHDLWSEIIHCFVTIFIYLLLCFFSTTPNDHYFTRPRFYSTKWPLCANVPLSNHSFIHSFTKKGKTMPTVHGSYLIPRAILPENTQTKGKQCHLDIIVVSWLTQRIPIKRLDVTYFCPKYEKGITYLVSACVFPFTNLIPSLWLHWAFSNFQS